MRDVVVYFISLGANPRAKNMRGFSPLDLAEKIGNKDILQIVQEAVKIQGDEEEVVLNTVNPIKEYLKDMVDKSLKKGSSVISHAT